MFYKNNNLTKNKSYPVLKNSYIKVTVLAFISVLVFITFANYSLASTNITSKASQKNKKEITVKKKAKKIAYAFTNKEFINELNKERKREKLSDLTENKDLNKIAEERLKDLIEYNYFAHDSPSGKNVDYFLNNSNYEYIKRGENLAYGEFKNEDDVTAAWMQSKWHKYNILYPDFDQIGIAYYKGNYMGGEYLLVVHVFAESSNTNLASKIAKN
jgi:uncharacterized protein YkwD